MKYSIIKLSLSKYIKNSSELTSGLVINHFINGESKYLSYNYHILIIPEKWIANLLAYLPIMSYQRNLMWRSSITFLLMKRRNTSQKVSENLSKKMDILSMLPLVERNTIFWPPPRSTTIESPKILMLSFLLILVMLLITWVLLVISWLAIDTAESQTDPLLQKSTSTATLQNLNTFWSSLELEIKMSNIAMDVEMLKEFQNSSKN